MHELTVVVIYFYLFYYFKVLVLCMYYLGNY